MNWFVTSLRENPELAIFLTLAIGFVVGRIRIGTFSLGNVVGTLLAGVLVGQLDVKVDPLVKVVFFDLFLFATGYKVGPQFFRGLKKNALSQAAPDLVLCVASLVTTVVSARVMGYDCGTAAGLMAGAFTESTVIGTAGNTITRLDIPAEEKERLLNNIPVAYAVSYLVGTGFVVWFLSSLAPRLLRVDLRAESRKLEARAQAAGSKSEARPDPPTASGTSAPTACPLEAGRAVADVEASFAPGARVRGADPPRRGRLLAPPEALLRCGRRRGDRRRGGDVLLAGTRPSSRRWRIASSSTSPWRSLDVVVTGVRSRTAPWPRSPRSTGAAWRS